MEIPPQKDWLDAHEVAKRLGVRVDRLYYARRVGRTNVSGELVRLKMIRTARGWVTTQSWLDEFHRQLNG